MFVAQITTCKKVIADEPAAGQAPGWVLTIKQRVDLPSLVERRARWATLIIALDGEASNFGHEFLRALEYAHDVVHDYAERFPAPGSYVRSTLLVSFSEGFVFQTRNTVYVLLGRGKRKRAKPEVLRGAVLIQGGVFTKVLFCTQCIFMLVSPINEGVMP